MDGVEKLQGDIHKFELEIKPAVEEMERIIIPDPYHYFIVITYTEPVPCNSFRFDTLLLTVNDNGVCNN